jgi:hypothetical protein
MRNVRDKALSDGRKVSFCCEQSHFIVNIIYGVKVGA